MSKLHCAMRDCANVVTHIGEKGWVYCAECAKDRQYQERCRRMRQWERQRLEQGSVISYRQWTQAEATQFDAEQEKPRVSTVTAPHVFSRSEYVERGEYD